MFESRINDRNFLTAGVKIRRFDIDDLAAVRSFQTALRRGVVPSSSSPPAEHCRADDWIGPGVFGAWIDAILAGVVRWSPEDPENGIATIQDVSVHPIFRRGGVGELLVAYAEACASCDGFTEFRISADVVAASYFERLGYRSTIHSHRLLADGRSALVAHLQKQQLVFGDLKRRNDAGNSKTIKQLFSSHAGNTQLH